MKQFIRLADRRVQHAASVAADNMGGKGYRQPGSMNRHKSFPIGKPKAKKR
jgi:hypothetical protein